MRTRNVAIKHERKIITRMRCDQASVYLTMTGAIATIDNGAWTAIKRTHAIFDEHHRWI